MIKAALTAAAVSLSISGCSLAKSTIVPEAFLPCQEQSAEALRINVPNLVFEPKDRAARQRVEIVVISIVGDQVEYLAWHSPLSPYGWHIQFSNSLNGPDYYVSDTGSFIDRRGRIFEVRARAEAFIPILIDAFDDVVGHGTPDELTRRISTKCFYKVNPPL